MNEEVDKEIKKVEEEFGVVSVYSDIKEVEEVVEKVVDVIIVLEEKIKVNSVKVEIFCSKRMVDKFFIFLFVGFLGVGKIFFVCFVVIVFGCKFYCIFFGGVCDEVEICGYRRIYVVVMLGFIV